MAVCVGSAMRPVGVKNSLRKASRTSSGEALVLGGFAGASERPRGARGSARRPVVECRRHIIGIRSAKAGTLHRVVQCQPVGEVESTHPEPAAAAWVSVLTANPVGPELHILILAFEERPVSVELYSVHGMPVAASPPCAGAEGPGLAGEGRFLDWFFNLA